MRSLLLLLTFSALLCFFGDAKRLGNQPLQGPRRVAVGGSTGGLFKLQPVFVPGADGVQVYGSDLPITADDVKQLLQIKMAAQNRIVVLSGSHGGESKRAKGNDPLLALALGNLQKVELYLEPQFFQEDAQTMSRLFLQLENSGSSWFKRSMVDIIDIYDWLIEFNVANPGTSKGFNAMVDFIDTKVTQINPDVLIMGWCHGSQSPIIHALAKKRGWVATGAVGTNAGLVGTNGRHK